MQVLRDHPAFKDRQVRRDRLALPVRRGRWVCKGRPVHKDCVAKPGPRVPKALRAPAARKVPRVRKATPVWRVRPAKPGRKVRPVSEALPASVGSRGGPDSAASRARKAATDRKILSAFAGPEIGNLRASLVTYCRGVLETPCVGSLNSAPPTACAACWMGTAGRTI